jgi:hypothetical protein
MMTTVIRRLDSTARVPLVCKRRFKSMHRARRSIDIAECVSPPAVPLLPCHIVELRPRIWRAVTGALLA